jgi:hypothetical protein
MGRGYVRYRPGRPPDLATEAEVQAMNAKLAKRVKEVGNPALVSSPRAPQSLPAKLEWERAAKDSTAVKTLCGRYSCAKLIVLGKTTYELWKLLPGWPAKQLHKGLDNFLQAQVLAQQDADKHP